MNTNFTDGYEGNEDLTESLRDRIMGKAISENLHGLRIFSWVVEQYVRVAPKNWQEY
jgi:hypothetical protein